MTELFTKISVTVMGLIVCCTAAMSQNIKEKCCVTGDCIADTTLKSKADSCEIERMVNEKYHKRIDRYMRRWASLVPNKYTLQYAGDIGMLSVGVGWGYGKRQQWETHVMMGYLPKNHTPDEYWSFTLKQIYIPWSIRLNRLLSVEPLYCTVFINSILSSDFWTKEPDRYPKGYYGFSSKMRFHVGLGQKVTIHIPTEKRYLADKFSVYYGVSTCDLYVRQKFLNSSIPLKDIICLAVGIQYTVM